MQYVERVLSTSATKVTDTQCTSELLGHFPIDIIPNYRSLYRGLLYFVQTIVKKDPGRARQNSLAAEEPNFTKPGTPGTHNKIDLCTRPGIKLVPGSVGVGLMI